jgi:hypothetical protein
MLFVLPLSPLWFNNLQLTTKSTKFYTRAQRTFGIAPFVFNICYTFISFAGQVNYSETTSDTHQKMLEHFKMRF